MKIEIVFDGLKKFLAFRPKIQFGWIKIDFDEQQLIMMMIDPNYRNK
jgi:hypothetical protein